MVIQSKNTDGRLGLRQGLKGLDLPFSRRELSRQVSRINHQIQAEFGRDITDNVKFWRGMYRKNDACIWQALGKLAAIPKPIRILEIGGGVTYPCLDDQHGSPWISRLASLLIPRLSECVIVDTTGKGGWPERDRCLVKRNQFGRIAMCTFHSEQIGEKDLSMAAKTLSAGDLFSLAEKSSSLGLALGDLNISSGSKGTFEVRPWLDEAFERRLSNQKISILGNTKWQSLECLEGLGSFDLIFGRHLAPHREPGGAKALEASLRSLHCKLASQGSLIVTFDNDQSILLEKSA